MKTTVSDPEKTIQLSSARIYMRPDGIVVVDVMDNIVFGLEQTAEIVNAIGTISGGKKAPVLSLFKPGNTADKDARDYIAGEKGSQFSCADGMVIHNLPQKIIANFYLKLNKPTKPTRFFSNEKEALKWLKKFL